MRDKTNTPDEILDLVNENDEVIGEVTKGEANSNPNLIHREACVIIFDENDRILIQQRSFKKKLQPGIWQITSAGHVPKGMSYEEAAHKELREEVGFDVPLTFVWKRLDFQPNETRFFSYWVGKYSGEQIKINKDEVEATKFIDLEELSEMFSHGIFSKGSKLAIEHYWKENRS